MPKLDNSYLIQMKGCNSLMQMTAAWVLQEKATLQLNCWCNKKERKKEKLLPREPTDDLVHMPWHWEYF